MPKYYCDYCHDCLINDSPSVRKTHVKGRKHLLNVKRYYQHWLDEKIKPLVAAKTEAYKTSQKVNQPTIWNYSTEMRSFAMEPSMNSMIGKMLERPIDPKNVWLPKEEPSPQKIFFSYTN